MSYRIAFLLAVLMLLIVWAFPVAADPIAVTTKGGVTVTLYNEPCALTAVSNLPSRATWKEDGKTYEGCAGGHRLSIDGYVLPVVLFYFDDKSMGAAPLSDFKRATGA